MIKEDDKNFQGCKNTFDENDVELRDHCHVTGKY